MKSRKRSLVMVLMVACSIFAAINLAGADHALAAAAVIDDLGQLSAEWWQVMLSIPTAQNPMLDTTGSACMVGQRGSVWFLAGSFAGGKTTLTRTCTVPAGKALFFPVVNSIWFNTPGLCGSPAEPQTVEELRVGAAADIDAATGMLVKVDGRIINTKTRVESPVFEVFLPEKNVFDSPCAPIGFPGGVYSPAVADGYYVKLEPLTEGKHTIRIKGSIGTSLQLDVTYKLTVVPVSQE